LKIIEKKATVVVPTDFPYFLNWIPGADNILIFTDYSKRKTIERKFAEADLIFILDLNTSNRMGEVAPFVLHSKAKKIHIDHHVYPEKFADVLISHPEISSTSEMIFRLICRMGDFAQIDIECAQCIYTGMMTDTGCFSYNSNSPEIYSIIYELLKIGVDKDAIYNNIYNTCSVDKMRLTGYALYNKMKIYPEYKTAIITLDADEIKQFNYRVGDTEGLVNMPLQIQDVVFSVFFRKESDKIKISFRSQGNFPANKVASDIFGGGGHFNAAGGECYESLESAVKKLEDALPNYAEEFMA
ncbi:MAG: DHH family phosphoesterase, partial [Paludibacter sp.]|nr:DHH family phosphoesterase [Paludibacter sp.]